EVRGRVRVRGAGGVRRRQPQQRGRLHVDVHGGVRERLLGEQWVQDQRGAVHPVHVHAGQRVADGVRLVLRVAAGHVQRVAQPGLLPGRGGEVPPGQQLRDAVRGCAAVLREPGGVRRRRQRVALPRRDQQLLRRSVPRVRAAGQLHLLEQRRQRV